MSSWQPSDGDAYSLPEPSKFRHKRGIWPAAAAAAKSLQSCLTLCDPHRRQPTKLPCPWDSPGKNTGVGCHFLLQCMKVKSESEATQSCPTLSDPMDCNPPGSPVHGIFQAGVLEWGAIAFSGIRTKKLHNTWDLDPFPIFTFYFLSRAIWRHQRNTKM